MRRTESAAHHKQNKREARKSKERKFKVVPSRGGINSKKAFKGSRPPECTAIAPGTCTLSCSLVTHTHSHTDALAKTKPFL